MLGVCIDNPYVSTLLNGIVSYWCDLMVDIHDLCPVKSLVTPWPCDDHAKGFRYRNTTSVEARLRRTRG